MIWPSWLAGKIIKVTVSRDIWPISLVESSMPLTNDQRPKHFVKDFDIAKVPYWLQRDYSNFVYMKIYAHVFSSFSDIFCKGKYCRDTSTIQLGCICSDSENVSTVSILYCPLYKTVYTMYMKSLHSNTGGLIFGWMHGNHGLIRLLSFLWHAESSGVLDKGVQLVLPPLHLGHRALGGPNMLHCCQVTAKIFLPILHCCQIPVKIFRKYQ